MRPRGFATIVLKEPPKNEVLAYAPGADVARHAFAVILDRQGNRTFEAVVDVKARRIISWAQVKGVQPGVMESEYDVMVRAVKTDQRWQAAMKKRGIDDLDMVQVDNWRLARCRRNFNHGVSCERSRT